MSDAVTLTLQGEWKSVSNDGYGNLHVRTESGIALIKEPLATAILENYAENRKISLSESLQNTLAKIEDPESDLNINVEENICEF